MINPGIVYGSISGFGQDGPYAERPCLDQIAQGMGGHMLVTGVPGDGPMRSGAAISDATAGILCANGIALALLERERSGEGQWVQTSLLEAMIFLLDFQAARWLVDQRSHRSKATITLPSRPWAPSGRRTVSLISRRCRTTGPPSAKRRDWRR